MGEPAIAESRREYRKRVFKGAAILTGMNNSEVTCAIRNMHANGAELVVPADARIPPEFLLYIKVDDIAYKAVVRWRRSDRVGVMFTGTEPKPHWHYG